MGKKNPYVHIEGAAASTFRPNTCGICSRQLGRIQRHTRSGPGPQKQSSSLWRICQPCWSFCRPVGLRTELESRPKFHWTRKDEGGKKIELQKNKLTFFIGYSGWNVCGQAAGGQRLPLAICTTGDLLSSIQLETVHAGEVEAVPHPERLPGGAEGVGHRRAGAGGLPLWTNQNRHVYYPQISAYISHTHVYVWVALLLSGRIDHMNWFLSSQTLVTSSS